MLALIHNKTLQKIGFSIIMFYFSNLVANISDNEAEDALDLFHTKQYDLSLKKYENIRTIAVQQQDEIQFNIGCIYLAKKKYESALQIFNNIQTNSPALSKKIAKNKIITTIKQKQKDKNSLKKAWVVLDKIENNQKLKKALKREFCLLQQKEKTDLQTIRNQIHTIKNYLKQTATFKQKKYSQWQQLLLQQELFYDEQKEKDLFNLAKQNYQKALQHLQQTNNEKALECITNAEGFILAIIYTKEDKDPIEQLISQQEFSITTKTLLQKKEYKDKIELLLTKKLLNQMQNSPPEYNLALYKQIYEPEEQTLFNLIFQPTALNNKKATLAALKEKFLMRSQVTKNSLIKNRLSNILPILQLHKLTLDQLKEIYFIWAPLQKIKQEIKNIVKDYDNNIEAIKNKEKTQQTLTKLLTIPLKEEENKSAQITIELLQNSITNNTSYNQVLTTYPKRASLLYQNAKQWLCRAINILSNKNSAQEILQKSIAEQIYSQKTTENVFALPNQQNYTPITTMLTNNQKWVIREAMPFVNTLTKIEKKLRKDIMHLHNLGTEKAILAKDLIQKNKLLSAKVQQEVATKHWEKALALLKNQHDPPNKNGQEKTKKQQEKKLLKLMQELQEMEKEDNPQKIPTIIQNNKKVW